MTLMTLMTFFQKILKNKKIKMKNINEYKMNGQGHQVIKGHQHI
jgi:hypothetical protein